MVYWVAAQTSGIAIEIVSDRNLGVRKGNRRPGNTAVVTKGTDAVGEQNYGFIIESVK